MTNEDYQDLLKQSETKGSDDFLAGIIIFSVFFSTLFFIILSSFAHDITWLIAQFFLGINILQWFFILHDLAHDKYFSERKVNVFVGHIASLFAILPFYPWKYIHRAHHFWTGYKDKDPTQRLLTIKDIPEQRFKIINFCWKYWVPIFTLSFSLDNFWNIKKLDSMFPEKKLKNYFSILLPIIFHLYFILSMGPIHYLKTWGFAYFIFLFFCDPLLLSQHSGKKQMLAKEKNVSMVHYKDQDEYTRSLKVPYFIERFIILGFNHHSLHHLLPTLPGYRLAEMNFKDSTQEDCFVWLKKAKSITGVDLLYSEELNLKQ